MRGHPGISYMWSFSLTVIPITNFCTEKKQHTDHSVMATYKQMSNANVLNSHQ